MTATDALTDKDREALKTALASLAEADEPALIPLDVDLDGDGIVDAWGLDASGEVVLVSGTPLSETAYVSDGDDATEEAS